MPDTDIAISSTCFYSYVIDRKTWFEFVQLLQHKLHPPVDMHVMFALISDEHELLDEYLSKCLPATIEHAVDSNAETIRIAKNPLGHPWPTYSIVIPIPRFALDTPILLDDIVNNMLTIIHRLKTS